MNATLAVRIPCDLFAQLGALRTTPGLEVHEDGDALWLRTADPSDEMQTALRSIAVAELFRVLADGQLVPIDARLPKGHLPQSGWQSLQTYLRVELPTAALAGAMPPAVPLKLVPVTETREPNVLLVDQHVWREYAVTAPQLRLDRWHFAFSISGEVLVRGTPLPPLPGRRFVEQHGITLPAGFGLSPCVDTKPLAAQDELADNDLLLWIDENRRERIPAEHFVRATRAAVRCSITEPTDV